MDQKDQVEKACAIVGEVVLLSSALDQQLNKLVISVLGIISSPMLEPVVASLDSNRKISILKSYATTIKSSKWKSVLKDYCKSVESVNKARNIAAHWFLSFDGDIVYLKTIAAEKLFRNIKLDQLVVKKIDLDYIEENSRKAEEALGSGAELIVNFDRVHTERVHRNKRKTTPKN